MDMEMQSVEPTDVGARIRAARQRVGLTQAELAGSIVSPSYLSRLEAGGRSPARETLERLATALDLTVDQLLSGDLPADHTEADAASRVDQAELLLAGGELDQAMRIVEDLLGTPGVRRLPSIRARAGLVRGLVWEARNDLSAAIGELEDVVASSASHGAPSTSATAGCASSRWSPTTTRARSSPTRARPPACRPACSSRPMTPGDERSS